MLPNWVGEVVFPKEVDEALGNFIRLLSALQVVYIQFISDPIVFLLACFEGLRNSVNVFLLLW